jgi:hypothetical protein
MPEELFAIRPWRCGGRGDFARRDIRMATTAVRKRYNLSPEQRRKMLIAAEAIMDTGADEKTKLLAIKLMAEMDKADFERDKEESKTSDDKAGPIQINIQINEQLLEKPPKKPDIVVEPKVIEHVVEASRNGDHPKDG